ncbi:MAG: hypothetical protein K1X72_12080 [Pyrinomonadaceae bacterium]|nr:hypothetical protein [Pyrinomonadaceae bacterium]
MSFKIFASGPSDFHYNADKNIEGDDFELTKLLGILNQAKPTVTGVATAIADVKSPSMGVTDFAELLAYREFVHNLKNAVDLLAMNSNVSQGWIFLSVTIKNLIFSDTIKTAKYSFSPGTNPGKEFVSKIYRTLEDTGMNHWGVIRALSTVLSKFANELSDSKTPAINISITK